MTHHHTFTVAPPPEPESFSLGKTCAEGFAWCVVYAAFAFLAVFVL